MRVISASRRTDIPAFYAGWFMNRVRAGFCHWIHPYTRQMVRTDLTPDETITFVFWTRNARPLIPHLPELDERGHKYYFMVTLLGYPQALETRAPALDAAIATFQGLSEIVSPEFIFWRYDPIVISNVTPRQYHLDRFAHIAERLAGYTGRCIYSFLDMYGKTERNLSRLRARENIVFESPDREARHGLLRELVDVAQANEMGLYSCCEDDFKHIGGLQRSHCVDLDVLRKLTCDPDLGLRSKPTRTHCGCVESVDIGSYDTCLFGCTYCYATNSRNRALRNHALHDPADTILYRPQALVGIDLDTRLMEKVTPIT